MAVPVFACVTCKPLVQGSRIQWQRRDGEGGRTLARWLERRLHKCRSRNGGFDALCSIICPGDQLGKLLVVVKGFSYHEQKGLELHVML